MFDTQHHEGEIALVRHPHRALIALSLAFIAPNATAAPAREKPRPAATESPHCALPRGWDAIAARKPRYVVFGELHGTEQAPAFVGDVACALAARGARLLIAIEHSASSDEALQRAWNGPAESLKTILAEMDWAARDDGVGSVAMFEMIRRLHQLKLAGRSIDIVAYNGIKNEDQRRRFAALAGQGPHDAAQAENIERAADRGYDLVLVLTGNIHARKQPVTFGGVTFEPMAMRIARSGELVSLDMLTAGGSAWTCQAGPGVTARPGQPLPAGAISCGARDLGPSPMIARAPFIDLRSAANPGDASRYDGVFYLGKVRASPPAVKAAR